MLRKMTIKHKVFALAFLGAFMAFGIAGGAIYSITTIGVKLKQIAEEDIPLTSAVTEITVHQLEQAIMFERAVRYAEIIDHNQAAIAGYKKSKTRFLELAKKVDKEILAAEKQVADIIKYEVAHGGEQAIIDEFRHVEKILHKVEKEHASFDKHVEEVFALFEAGRNAEAERMASEVEKEEDKLDHELESLLFELESFTAEAALNAEHIEQKFLKILVVASSIATLLFLVFAFTIVRGIIRPLLATKLYADQLAKGDLNAVQPTHNFEDEIADMMTSLSVFKENAVETDRLREQQKEQARLNEESQQKSRAELAGKFQNEVGGSIEALASAAAELQNTANTMKRIAEETSQASQTVASSSEAASSNVNTVASAMEEMRVSSSEISSQITSVNNQSTQASNNAQNASEKIEALNTLVENVDEVVISIQDIAEQTNLLALNATIEAARAGEAGKGFAVVAEEVKKLAGATGQKTDEISGRITEIQEATQAAVEAMKSIITNIGDIDHSVTGVSAAVEEQNATTAEITRSVAEASQGAQSVSQVIVEVQKGADETETSSNNVLTAAQELTQLSETLRQSVNAFLDDIRGAGQDCHSRDDDNTDVRQAA